MHEARYLCSGHGRFAYLDFVALRWRVKSSQTGTSNTMPRTTSSPESSWRCPCSSCETVCFDQALPRIALRSPKSALGDLLASRFGDVPAGRLVLKEAVLRTRLCHT